MKISINGLEMAGAIWFRHRPDYASQRMFEKLGALPNGISEFMLENER